MSPLSARFSSSSRSMRSMKDFSCSPATPPTSGMDPLFPHHDAAPAARCRKIAVGLCRRKAEASTCRTSVILGGGEGGFLLGAGFFLIFRPPFVVGHPINDLPRLRVRQRQAALLGFGAIPLRQAVPAEAGQVHQIDVLDIGPLAQMLDETAKRCRFELGAGLVVHRDLQFVAEPYVAPRRARLKR